MKALVAVSLAVSVAACGGRKASPPGGCTHPLTIDDLEDGDRWICESEGRHGSWHVFDDGTSTNVSPQGDFTPTLISEAREASRYAARMTGFGPTGWGAEMFVSLNGDALAPSPHDASCHCW